MQQELHTRQITRETHPKHKELQLTLKNIMGSSIHKRNQDLDYKLEVMVAYGPMVLSA